MIAAAFAVLLQAATPPPPAAAVTVARGGITPRIVCASDPRFSYALFLPKEYGPERAWPILYVFDPRGRGAFAAELFAEAATAHGFVVASSNDTQSDDPGAPNAAAITALWFDTHSRIAIDPKRRYAAGFSGTARLAARLAMGPDSGFAGVIAVGGRLAADVRGGKAPWPFAVWGAAGDHDFNHPETWRLDELLAGNRTPHRIAGFEGGHQWMPKEMALEALDWFAVRGGAPPDATIVERYRAAMSARAGALEAAGRVGEALRTWEGLAEDLAGTPAAEAAAGQAERLGEPARRDLQRVRKLVASDLAWIEDANDRIAALAREEMPALPRLLREFDVDGLRRQASAADAVTAHSAARRLSLVATNASFYVPELLKSRGQLASAARWYELAIAIDPDAPGPHLGLARVRARTGNRKAAIDALRVAVSRGLRVPRQRLAEDPELAALAGDPAFEEILRSLPSS